MTPIHVRVEAEITKGQYNSFDTFLGSEAAEYLRLYLDSRCKGSPYCRKGTHERKIPPEVITDESPLICNTFANATLPISEKQIYRLIHSLYFRAGLLARNGKRYDLKVHSLRKFFKTQLIARGVPESYAEYMMGHTADKYGYNDVESLGVERLRNIYATANVKIKEEHKATDRELLKKTLGVLVKESGLDPDKVIMWGALAEPHRTIVKPEDLEDNQIKALSSALRGALKQEIINEIFPESTKFVTGIVGPKGFDAPVTNFKDPTDRKFKAKARGKSRH